MLWTHDRGFARLGNDLELIEIDTMRRNTPGLFSESPDIPRYTQTIENEMPWCRILHCYTRTPSNLRLRDAAPRLADRDSIVMTKYMVCV
jgi:hypothetical protein